MALAVANSWENGGTTTALAATVSGFQTGDLAVVLAFGFDGDSSGATMIITDNASGANTYTKRAESTQDSTTFRSWAALFSSVIVTAPTTISIGETGLPTTPLGIVVLRVTGNHATPFDQANAGTSSSDDPISPSITTTAADEIIVVGLCHDGADVTFDPPTGYTMAQEQESNADQAYAVAYKIVSSSGSQAPQWATGGASDYGMVIASFKAAAGGTDTTVTAAVSAAIAAAVAPPKPRPAAPFTEINVRM